VKSVPAKPQRRRSFLSAGGATFAVFPAREPDSSRADLGIPGPMTAFAAVAGGAYIFVAVLVVGFFIVAYGWYSRSGSTINQRPHDGREGSAGARGKSSISTTESDVERTVGTRGTKL
jgi:hypothetical protein